MRIKSNGFSIVEILMVTGIVSIIAAGVASMMTNSFRAQRGIQAKDQQHDFTSEIRNLLADKNACHNTFSGRNAWIGFSVIGSFSFKNDTNINRYSIGQTDKTGMLEIARVSLQNWVVDTSATTTVGTASLFIGLNKTGNTGSGKEVKPDQILLKIRTDNSGLITECFSVGGSGLGYWMATPANMNDIYYAGGQVAIGTNLPSASLTVSGDQVNQNSTSTSYSSSLIFNKDRAGSIVQSGDELGQILGAGFNGTNYQYAGYIKFRAQGSVTAASIPGSIEFATTPSGLNTPVSRMYIDNAGNVGIGNANPIAKLDVNGAIRPGMAGVVTGGICALPEGSIGYDMTAHSLVFCDQIGHWKSSGGGTIYTNALNVSITGLTTYTYNYGGTRNPLQIFGVVYIGSPGNNTSCTLSVRWETSAGVMVKDWTPVAVAHPFGSHDGGAYWSEGPNLSIPFIDGSKRISFRRNTDCGHMNLFLFAQSEQ